WLCGLSKSLSTPRMARRSAAGDFRVAADAAAPPIGTRAGPHGGRSDSKRSEAGGVCERIGGGTEKAPVMCRGLLYTTARAFDQAPVRWRGPQPLRDGRPTSPTGASPAPG